MTKEELVKKYNKLDCEYKELQEQQSKIYKKQANLLAKYANDNRVYQNGTILRLKVRTGKAIRYKIVMVSDCFTGWSGENLGRIFYEYKQSHPNHTYGYCDYFNGARTRCFSAS